jgi:hypothetical protein
MSQAMTTNEKLNAIADKCRALLSSNESETTRAGYRSTLAAITALEDMGEADADVLGANILAAWEGLL